MVKFYDTSYTYDYPFSTVSLAYFLRYPNPYSRHVASTDTISRTFDPETQRLTTVRLHLKRSRLPPSLLKILPKGSVGASVKPLDSDGRTASFILERSVVDVKEGWMETESRNLDWNNIISVIERQSFRRPVSPSPESARVEEHAGRNITLPQRDDKEREKTDVSITVTLKSRIGEQIRKRRQRWGEQASATSVSELPQKQEAQAEMDEEAPVKQGWFSSWSSGAVRSAIEAVSLQRTERSQPKAQQGMSIVLARLREGGLQAVFEGMERDKEVTL